MLRKQHPQPLLKLAQTESTQPLVLQLLFTSQFSATRTLCAGTVPEATPEERSSTVFRSGNERLYEAYNDLHSLAQDFEKPFDAPAILVVGHQTDGKSGEQRQPAAVVLARPARSCQQLAMGTA